MRQVQRSVVRRARNFVQSVSDGANEIFDAIAGNGGDGMEFEAALFAEIPEYFEPRVVCGGVKLGSNYHQRLFCQGCAEGGKLAVDDFEGVDGVIGVRITSINEMSEQTRAFDVAEEAYPEAGAFMRTF